MILLVVWFENGDCSALTSKASSKVNFLNDYTHRWVCVTVIVLSFGQIEQGAHYIRKSLIYSTRKAFLEHTVVEIVKFDEKSTSSVWKGELTAKVPFKLLLGHIYIYIYQDMFPPPQKELFPPNHFIASNNKNDTLRVMNFVLIKLQ